jgi:hypothetical protein
VGEFDAFAIGGEDDGMVADDVAAADGMDADLGSSAFAGDALAAVAEGFSELDLADLARISRRVVAVPLGASFLRR